METRAPLNSLPGPLSQSLSTALHNVPLLIALSPLLWTLSFANLNRGPIAKYFFGYPQDWAGAGTFEPSSPIMKPAPKRLRTLLSLRNQPLSPAGTWPARSKLNDLVRLRAAIITSCIYGATKESRESPVPLTFLVRRLGFRGVATICGSW